MITELELTNFRGVSHDLMRFEPGLVVIRAPSEKGKSTRLHAIKYALWGAKALGQPLADVVTWGLKETALKVSLTLALKGRTYTFVRHKGGASVFVDGDSEPYVTGQTEVTEFATQLVGSDGPTAERLMFSSQGRISGALAQGAKATSEMIEDLADFTLFEDLLSRMSQHLMIGSDVAVKGRLDHAKKALEDVQLDEPDLGSFDQEMVRLEQEIEDNNQAKELLQAEIEGLASMVEQSNAQHKAYREYLTRLEDLKTKVVHLEQRLESARAQGSVASFEPSIQTLMQKVQECKVQARTFEAYTAFMSLPEPSYEWEGDEDSFLQAKQKTQAHLDQIKSAETELLSEIKVLKASKVPIKENCPTCGQKIQDYDQLARHNAELDAKIEQVKAQLGDLTLPKGDLEVELVAYQAIDAAIRNRSKFMQDFGTHVKADDQYQPNRLTWKGEYPQSLDIGQLNKELESLQKKEKARVEAMAMAMALESQVTEARLELEKVQQDKPSEPESSQALALALANLRQTLNQRTSQAKDLANALFEVKSDKQAAVTAYEYSLKSRQSLQEQVNQAQADLDTLTFNNQLIKKIRTCRPIVSDKLWSMILGAVSASFSKMRGTKTHITKDKDGFLANGQSVESLSGSTLDLLGLSIRSALLKTFVPDCPFLILDEPMAQCSDDRAALMLAYIKMCDFPQVILVTHEEVSSDQADQLIVLE